MSIHWWFFWPFCPLIHSRKPALVMKPPAYDRYCLACKCCSAELPRYEAKAQAMEPCLEKPGGGCAWPLCKCEKPGDRKREVWTGEYGTRPWTRNQ